MAQMAADKKPIAAIRVIEYGRGGFWGRRRWRRFAAYCLVVLGLAAGARTIAGEIQVLQRRIKATYNRDQCYKMLCNREPFYRGVVFDESRCYPALVYANPWYGSPTKLIRFKGDTGIAPPMSVPPAMGIHGRVLSYFESIDRQAGSNGRVIWCASSGLGLPVLPGIGWIFVNGDTTPLFIHGRRAKGGVERLVVVEFDATGYVTGKKYPLLITTYARGGLLQQGKWSRSMKALGLACAAGELLQLSEGNADPSDESHFTIPYSIGKRSGVIDGWLTQDGNDVKLVAHEVSSALQGKAVLTEDGADGRR